MDKEHAEDDGVVRVLVVDGWTNSASKIKARLLLAGIDNIDIVSPEELPKEGVIRLSTYEMEKITDLLVYEESVNSLEKLIEAVEESGEAYHTEVKPKKRSRMSRIERMYKYGR